MEETCPGCQRRALSDGSHMVQELEGAFGLREETVLT